MAPDAEKLRQRHGPVTDTASLNTETVVTERVCSVKELEGNEVCIDGVIYDITSFHHPGGEQIKMMGGNDVTVQYKMIHPFHTSKHLEKMRRVGKVTDFHTE